MIDTPSPWPFRLMLSTWLIWMGFLLTMALTA